MKKLIIVSTFLILLGAVSFAKTVETQPTEPVTTSKVVSKKSKRIKASGETGRKLEAYRKKRKSGGYKSWKRQLPFWPRKLFLLFELAIYITAGVLIAQMLEVGGIVRYLSVVAWPIIKLGGLRKETGPAFLMAFQSGAVANSMLVSSRDDGSIDNRELYTSVFVVSAISLFAHLPSFIVPVGAAFGWEATCVLFSVRFGAVFLQILTTLVVSKFIIAPYLARRPQKAFTPTVKTEHKNISRKCRRKDSEKLTYWQNVWKRSKRTLKRLLVYLIPTYLILSGLEYGGFFKWLAETLPSLFQWSFLPAESAAIIPAQAVNMYNGAIAAANFIDSGAITVRQAVLVILAGSIITAPLRTMKHALPSYIAILGPRSGSVMAISAQILRTIFLIFVTAIMWLIW